MLPHVRSLSRLFILKRKLNRVQPTKERDGQKLFARVSPETTILRKTQYPPISGKLGKSTVIKDCKVSGSRILLGHHREMEERRRGREFEVGGEKGHLKDETVTTCSSTILSFGSEPLTGPTPSGSRTRGPLRPSFGRHQRGPVVGGDHLTVPSKDRSLFVPLDRRRGRRRQ